MKKYFTYAIGEILLVVIGISLAFQLDNWNEDMINRNIAVQYYDNIRDRIDDDQELIQEQMEFNKGFMREYRYAFDIIDSNDKSKLDTLGMIIRNTTQYSDFDRQGNIYETMVNSGEIKILRNHDIVNGVRELEEYYIYLNRIESIHYDAMINHVVKTINPVLKFSTGELMKPEAVFNYEFQNLFFMLLHIMEEKDEVYQKILNQIENLKTLIDEEIGN
ncbi:DUF6090 family protein [Lutimonas zeaxanthinifaciens]|uniref:DUF6090 family protein n=1 Tax=Lutimonas zeaxanthinifaciens TaxID=3060215 RepID=UPI00265CFF35|nr:DUF6090 family protein [Lutimonas sp. YSD2104]WKK64591.1 DUF6090 family protein [Lutimonas sp. YSD2104]